MGRSVNAAVGSVAKVSQGSFREALLAADGSLDQRELRHDVLHSAWAPVA